MPPRNKVNRDQEAMRVRPSNESSLTDMLVEVLSEKRAKLQEELMEVSRKLEVLTGRPFDY